MKIVTVRVEVATTTGFPLDMDGGRDEDGYTYAQLSSSQHVYEQQLWPPVYETEVSHHHTHHMAPAEPHSEMHYGNHDGNQNEQAVFDPETVDHMAAMEEMMDQDGVPKVRQAANVRERKRMCSINKAFEVSHESASASLLLLEVPY